MRSAYHTGDAPGVGTLQRIKIERSGFERLAARSASWRSFSRQRSVILLDHGPVFRWNLGGSAESRFPSRVAIEFPPDIELEVLEAGDDRLLQLVGAAGISGLLQPAQLPNGLVERRHVDSLSREIAPQCLGALNPRTNFAAELPGIRSPRDRSRPIRERASRGLRSPGGSRPGWPDCAPFCP